MLLSYLSALSWYWIFGFIHELSHIIAALALSTLSNHIPYDYDDVWESLKWIDILFHRRFQLQLDPLLLEQEDRNLERNAFIIRQSGWIASVSIAFLVSIFSHRRLSTPRDDDGGKVWSSQCLQWCQLAACITALDAVWTDLLQMDPLFSSGSSASSTDDMNPSTITFFCGNFGVILLHSAWLDNNGGESVLKVLKKMIQVTMMRGAQSGGIVTFESKVKNDDDDDSNKIKMKSIRSRVVKSKRGDL